MSDKADENSKRSREENLRKAFPTIERTANRIDLDVSEIKLAESTYEQYLDQRKYPIDDIEDTALACLYIAAKFNGNPIIPEDITREDPVTTNRKSLLRRSKDITSDLSLELADLHDIIPFVDRICDNLETDESIRSRAKEIVAIAEEKNVVSGKKPAAVAAAAIYNASIDENEKITQNKVATAANVTEVTIRSRYPEQREVLETDP